jgi:hypothetical protein
MAFDTNTRNRLAKFVAEARRVLSEEFSEQLQSLYGISATGGIAPLERLTHLDAEGLELAATLRQRIAYLANSSPATGDATKPAIDRLTREQAFTVLNRLAAIRMAEKRGLIVESVGQQYQSKGFKVFESVAGSAIGETYNRYRCYLFCLFDELAIDLGALFDRRSPQSLLFPREKPLLALLGLLDETDIQDLWAEDETIGWIYQYYNDPAERKKMREESDAPRNGRELAVRNQFFTPRYVVEFLTDNTLGRIWYEMTQGVTTLKDQCRYLVRRPTEIFLKPGKSASEQPKQNGVSQEDLLKQPVFIPHRPLKDPRSILMLDPACGSMHFGLYAFDLFEAIYDEAWEIATGSDAAAKSGEAFAPFCTFAASFADKAAFQREVPRMIVEHNLHGIDIDPRAAQIAGLSLWLRAQRAWHAAGVKPVDRPRITRSNIVCAEPMPGDKVLLAEFVEQQFPEGERAAFGFLLETVFDRMTLAGEAGSLLKIEEEIRTAIAEAKKLWEKEPKHTQQTLFGGGDDTPEATQKKLDLSGITNEQFWEGAEERIYDALRDYAEQAESGGFQRRLFAEDAARGFAFIDVCRKRYDMVVMNPPFGEITPALKDYAASQFRRSKADILCMFVERATQLISPACFCAAITNRTPFFTDGTEAWREAFCLGAESTTMSLFADLGHKVLDAALVETAAYVLTRQTNQRDMSWFNVTQVTDKQSRLLQQLSSGGSVATLKDIEAIPGKRLSYWLPSSVVRCYADLPSLAGSVDSVDKGMSTTDDFRFIRAFWEVPDGPSPAAWMYYSKGGEYGPFASDVHLTVNWFGGGREISEVVISKYPYLNGDAGWVLHPETHHGFAGLTYTKRTTSSFSARLLPAGARVSDLANLVYDSSVDKLLGALVCLSTSPFHYLLDAAVPSIDSSAGGTAARHYEVGTLREVPVPAGQLKKYADAGAKFFRFAQVRYRSEEATNYFDGLPLLREPGSLRDASGAEERGQLKAQLDAIELHAKAERDFIEDYRLDEPAIEAVYDYMGPHPANLPHSRLSQLVEPSEVWKQTEEQLTSLLVHTYGGKRRFSKQTWVGGREIELWAYVANRAPTELAQELLAHEDFSQRNAVDFAARSVSYCCGVTYGRWDIRYATGESAAPEFPDPFAALPVCPPGQLQNAQGLPAGPEDVPASYPLKNIPWDGILVDDPNHPLDIERRVREVIEIIWTGKEGSPTAEAIELEACEILGVKTLRDYFRKPANFFADHLKRYSKSRRQAPIYWPLSTKSGSYTLWIYYHRLNDQTLHKCIADFLDPKIKDVDTELGKLTSKDSGRAADLREFLNELKDLKEEIERVIKLPWKPNLNDGVLITASPLWKLFRLSRWQRDLKACWEQFEKGDYDWAHLAYTIWPERVEKVCEKDRSIAIAHGLEHLCKVEPPKPKKPRGKKASS